MKKFKNTKFLFWILPMAFLQIICLHSFGKSNMDYDSDNDKIRSLVIVFDGLRPDYISEGTMPELWSFMKGASMNNSHLSVFPTLTRVNSSSFAAGAYIGTHGIMGNSLYLPAVNTGQAINTGDASDLINAFSLMDGQLFTSRTLGEILHSGGGSLIVFSTGSTGQSFLLNHTLGGGAIINPNLILPKFMKPDIEKNIGKIPDVARPNVPRHKWITDAYIHYGLADPGPDVSVIWYSDPDATAHGAGVGAPETFVSIKNVDAQLGRIVKAIDSLGLKDKVNIIITADHGFVTNTGEASQIRSFFQERVLVAGSDDVVMAGGAIYVNGEMREKRIEQIVFDLQHQPWVGAIFTKSDPDNSMKGKIEGTLSVSSFWGEHPSRCPDIYVTYNWNDDANQFGYKGSSYSPGTAGHGSSSPYEMSIPLIVKGPSFKAGYSSVIPSSMVDIIPTLLYLQGYPRADEMDGRVLSELLAMKDDTNEPSVNRQEITVSRNLGDFQYNLKLHYFTVDNHRYFFHTETTRVFK